MAKFIMLAFALLLMLSAPALGQPAADVVEPPVLSPLATSGPRPAEITPPTAEEVHASLEQGVDFLLAEQRKDGAWGSVDSIKYYVIYAPGSASHLAFRAAVSSLAIVSLIEARTQFDGEKKAAIDAAIDRGQQWLLEHGDDLRRAEPDSISQYLGYALYNVWGHAFSLHAFVALHERAEGDTDLQAKLHTLAEYQVDRLRRCAFINGGWGYYDMVAHTQRPSGSSISFTTATVLLGLKEAAKLGIEFPEKLEKEAIASIVRQRYPDFAYAYGDYLRYSPRLDINRPAGSLGRSQVCNLALRKYGDAAVTDDVLRTWLNRLIARNGWLSIGRKTQRPHESHFSIAGYFYYYGHFYAAMCVELLPQEEHRYYFDHLANVLMPLQESDGSWWDFPFYDYHQTYGTAMTVFVLARGQQAPRESAESASASTQP